MAELPYGEILVSVLGGGVGVKAFDWLTSRGQSKAYTMGAVDHAVQTAMTLVTDRLEKVEDQHNECQEHLQEVRKELAKSQREIDRLMAGRVASWGEEAPQ